jgi:hypothetical protein
VACFGRRAPMWMLNDETWSSRRGDVDQSPAREDGNIKRSVVSLVSVLRQSACFRR